MKKYSASIIFAIIVLASISCFYLFFSGRTEIIEDVAITTTHGDEEEIKGVTIHSHGYNNGVESTATVTSEHAVLQPQMLLNQVAGNASYIDQSMLRILELQKEYREFMRRKYSLANLYEDDNLLLFANPAHSAKELQVEYYDKVKNQSHKFTINIPKEYKGYEYINVQGVQFLDQKMAVVMEGEKREGTDLLLAYISLQQEKLLESRIVDSVQRDGASPYFSSSVAQSTEPSRYYPYGYVKQGKGNREQGYQLRIIDLKTGNLEEVAVPGMSDNSSHHYLKDGSLYFESRKTGALYRVELKTATIEEIIQIEGLEDEYLSNLLVKDDKAYILYSQYSDNHNGKKAIIYVVDLVEKKLLYEGFINQSNPALFNLDFTAITFN